MLVQTAVFLTAGIGYLLWFENNLETEANDRVLAPGRLIQSGQLRHSLISDKTRMHEIVGPGLVDALLVGINGNIFHALDPSLLGRQVSGLENIDAAWFREAGSSPKLIRHTDADHSYMIGITPLITFDNIAPFLYTYVKLDATVIEREKKQMRAATITAVLFGMLVTTVVIYGAFEWLLFRRIRGAVRMIGNENGDGDDLGLAMTASDELGLVELGLRKIAADRKRERSLRAEAETALIEVQARADASTSAARKAEVQAQRAQWLIDAVPGGLVTIDQAGIVLTCNDTAARGLDRPVDLIIGRPLEAFLRPAADDRSQVLATENVRHVGWPEVGVHRAVLAGRDAGEDEIEIVVGFAERPEPHRVVLLRQSVDTEVRHELELLSERIGQSFRLTSGQWQSVGERLAMLRDYIAGLEAEQRMVSEALDCVPLAVAVVDRKGTMRYANRMAEGLLDQKDGLLVLQGRLTASRSVENGQLRQHLLDVSTENGSALPWAVMRVERENGTAWLVRIAPLDRTVRSAPSAPDLIIVMISDPHMPMKPSTSALRHLHGLTYAEADIMGRLTVGMRIAEIASELDISVETVRTHLKSIFTKTGTSRQADLVRQAVLSGAVLREESAGGSAAQSTSALVAAVPTTSTEKGGKR